MFNAILSGDPGGEASRESRRVWGAAIDPPTFAWLPGLRIYPVRIGCPALRCARLPGSFCPVVARCLASGQLKKQKRLQINTGCRQVKDV